MKFLFKSAIRKCIDFSVIFDNSQVYWFFSYFRQFESVLIFQLFLTIWKCIDFSIIFDTSGKIVIIIGYNKLLDFRNSSCTFFEYRFQLSNFTLIWEGW